MEVTISKGAERPFYLGWAIGILEGEGCFSIHKSSNRTQCSIQCEMTDKEVLEKLQRVLGCGRINSRGTRRGKRKESWIFSIYKKDEINNICSFINRYMSSRRSKKINEILEFLNEG